MTKEEAIKVIEDGDWWDSYITESTIEGINADDELHEALDLALSALRPVSRERVERVWRGEWMFQIFGDQQDENDPRCQCSKCGSIETPLVSHRFCPHCGAPMTDEAVQMVMERLEALKDAGK